MSTPSIRHRSLPRAARILLCSVLLSIPGPATTAAPAANPSISVYINQSTPASQLSEATLRSIFSMRLTLWPDGTQIQVLVLADEHPLHRQFSKSVLGLFPYQLRQIWDRGVFSGTGTAPIQVSSEAEMATKLATTPGGIGYLIQQSNSEGIYLVERP